MSESFLADLPTDGAPAFPEGGGEETTETSPVENKDTDVDPSPEGEVNTQDEPEKNTPFHEHPRWKERESEWEDRFNKQEERYQQELNKIRQEFAPKQETKTEIPEWFGGDQKQWDQFQAFNQQQLEAAEKRALEKINAEEAKEKEAVKAATEYMNKQIDEIQSDSSLNPTGDTIDKHKLVKFTIDNDLVDSKGNWNYKAAWQLMQANTPTPTEKANNRKSVAKALSSDKRAEPASPSFKTSKDFATNKPW